MLSLSKKGASEVISYILIIFVVVVVIGIVFAGVMPAIEKANSKKKYDLSYKYIEEINQKINYILQEPNRSSTSIFLDLTDQTLKIDSSLKTLEIFHTIKGNYFKEDLFIREGNIYTKRELEKLIVGLELDGISFTGDLSLTNEKSTLYIVKVSKGRIHFTNEIDSSENADFLNQQINRPDIDRDAPVTTLFAFREDLQEHLSGWTDSQFLTISFSVDDDSDTTTYYCFDQDNTCIPNTEYTADFILTDPGINYVRFYSVDDERNKEGIKSRELKIERCLFPESGTWLVDGKEVCAERTIEVPSFIDISNNTQLLLYDVTLNLNTTTSTSVLRVNSGGLLRYFGGEIYSKTTSYTYSNILVYSGAHADIYNVTSSAISPERIYFYLYSGSTSNIKDSYFYSLRLYHTNANIENSSFDISYLFVETAGNTIDINNFDSRLSNIDYRFLSTNGIDINLTNVNLGTFNLYKISGNVNISNSYVNIFLYYNYDDSFANITNSDFYLFYYVAYANLNLILEDLTFPVVNYSRTIETSNNNILTLDNINYDYLYSYSNNSQLTTYRNSDVRLLYSLGTGNVLLENITIPAILYTYGSSKNTIKDSTIIGTTGYYAYQTSDTNIINSKILPSGSGTLRLYNTAKLNFIDTNSEVSRLNLIAGAHNPTISGYVKISSLFAWGAGNILKRYLPFNVKFTDGDFAENVLIEIKDGETLIDSGTTDENGYVNLLIEADNSSNPYKEYFVYADGLFIRTITILEDSSNGVEININIFDYNWLYKKQITIDSTKVDETLENFPLLFSIVDNDLKSYAKIDGTDIIFTNSEKTIKYKREIQDYNSQTGSLIAWVNIPNLSSTEDTNLYIYFGNEDTNEINDKDTWDENFSTVIHFKEKPNQNDVIGYHDSTINNNTGILRNFTFDENSTTDIPGKIGNSVLLNGIDNVIDISQTIIGDEITYSHWINKKFDNYRRATRQGGGATSTSYIIVYSGGNYGVYLGTGTPSPGYHMTTTGVLKTNDWSLVTWTYNKSELKLYVDGHLSRTINVSRDTDIDSGILYLGRSYGIASEHFFGQFDELRISNKVRSNSWIKTEYLNQSDPSSFYTIGSLQER